MESSFPFTACWGPDRLPWPWALAENVLVENACDNRQSSVARDFCGCVKEGQSK